MVRYCLPFARLPGKLRSVFLLLFLLLLFRLDLSLFDGDRAGENTHTRGANVVQVSLASVRAAVPVVEHVSASLDGIPIVPDCGHLSRAFWMSLIACTGDAFPGTTWSKNPS